MRMCPCFVDLALRECVPALLKRSEDTRIRKTIQIQEFLKKEKSTHGHVGFCLNGGAVLFKIRMQLFLFVVTLTLFCIKRTSHTNICILCCV